MSSNDELTQIQGHFHAVIRGRAGELVDEHRISLPLLASLLEEPRAKVWLPVLGMHGGFHYWLEGEVGQLKLIAESWCRVVGGSGQRHEITATGSTLVEEGFV